MKLMSFTKNGVAGFGAVQGDSVVDFSCKYPDLKSFLTSGDSSVDGELIAISDIKFEPVIPNPSRLSCA